MFKHILIPTDGSRQSRDAALAGVRLAAALGARVTGLFAAPAPTPIVYRDAWPVGYATPEKHARAIARATAAYLAVIETAAREAGVACTCVSVTNDFPANAILALAKRRRCDLIFMASHGRRGLRSILLGSETQKVLTGGRIPVLVYRNR